MPAERRDLNLFKVFAAVMEHRSLAAAGRELGLTSSAISHALARLRGVIGDELFLPGQRAMVPTPRALELAPRVIGALAELNDAVADKPFVPAAAQRTFRIGASDYASVSVLPKLVRKVLREAPRSHIRVMPIGRIDLVEHLDYAQLDVIIGWFDTMPERIRRRELMEEREAVVVRPGHPLSSGAPDLQALMSFPHVVVQLTGAQEVAPGGFFDERGLHRRVWIERLLLENAPAPMPEQLTAVTVPTFAAVPAMLRDTDLIATLPLRLAEELFHREELVMLELPYEPKRVSIEMAWHARADRDGGLQWLLAALEEACRPGDAS